MEFRVRFLVDVISPLFIFVFNKSLDIFYAYVFSLLKHRAQTVFLDPLYMV
jgi:hypothetical protein